MVSIIIPFKYDSHDRLENLLTLLSYIKKYWEFKQLIVSEMDSISKISSLLPSWADYVFAKEPENNLWSRSKRINLCLPLLNTPITVILDSDLIIDSSCFKTSIEKILKDEIDAITPFGEVYHFPRGIVLKEMKNEIKTKTFISDKKYSRKFIGANGGCFITKTCVFKHLRGMNELFKGWGLEDDELINRYLRLGYRYGRIHDYPAVHINHTRTVNCEINYEALNNSIIEKNRGILFDKNQMLEYFGVSSKPGELLSLNEPLPVDNKELEILVEREKSAYANPKIEDYEV